MKPICSIEGGWCVEPQAVNIDRRIPERVNVETDGLLRSFELPGGVSYEQFMRDYANCTTPIYFVEEE